MQVFAPIAEIARCMSLLLTACAYSAGAQGKKVYMPPAKLRGKLDLEALRLFVKDPSRAKTEL